MKNRADAPIITPEQMQLHELGLPVPVTEKVASVVTGRSRKRLQYERAKGIGLDWYRDGRSIRYLLSTLIASTGKGE